MERLERESLTPEFLESPVVLLQKKSERNRPVVQWLEWGSPKPLMRVRFSPGLNGESRMSFINFLKESREELKKVVWPSREEVTGSTFVVLGAVVVISLFLFLVDHLFEFLFDFLIHLGSGS